MQWPRDEQPDGVNQSSNYKSPARDHNLFRNVLRWQQPSFFQMPRHVRVAGRVRIVRHHNNRLLKAGASAAISGVAVRPAPIAQTGS